MLSHEPGTTAWWDARFASQADPDGTSDRHIRQVLELLPAEVVAYLAERGPRVLVWGCGTGASTRTIAEQFPRCDLSGVEFSPVAVERARSADPDGRYLLSEAGDAPRAYEVTLALDGLQHFANPAERLDHLLAACRDVCIVTVPLGERPLGPFSLSQFRRESLPDRHGKFEAILTREFVDSDRGRMLLAVYASAEFRRTHGRSDRAAQEQDKWDAYYTGLGEAEETPALQIFGSEFATVLDEFLPAGSSVLEAGCGAGFQSLALAREGRFKVSLMDISPQALEAAQRLFSRAGLQAEGQLGDVFAAGEANHDLVFNAGVLEHYTLDQQASFLRGMASRAKKYVLVLVPNRLCYWYWIWRVQQSRRGNWPFGKECPMADMGEAFRKAGLTFLGRAFLGAAWTEDLIANVQGLPAGFRSELLAVHRGGVADPAQRCYLTAALGCIGEAPAAMPARWSIGAGEDEMRLAEVTAGLADALALRLAAEGELRDLRARNGLLESEAWEAKTSLTSFRESAGYKLAEKLLRLRTKVAPKGSWRASAARLTIHTARTVVRPVKWVAARVAPPPPGFSGIRDRIAQSGRRPFVFLPSIPWSAVLFQRPQHLAREIAKLGHVVVYDCTGTAETNTGWVREIEHNVYLYHGPARHLAALREPVVWAFSYNYHQTDRFRSDATKLYDWIDDLTVFPHDQGLLRRNHDRAVKEADVVASVARRLHEQIVAVRPDAVYLPNAAEYDRFAGQVVRPTRDPELRELLTRSSAIAGYYGALASWFDYPLLKEVAHELPDWGFVLIGPDYDGSIHKAGLDECRNVKWIGPRDYATLPGYLQLFDVATIPFAINEITLATSPLKLFEYFSGGVPVVTTPMPECVAFPEVRIAATAAEFALALQAARASGRSPQIRARLREVGRENSWAARARQILEVVGGAAVQTKTPLMKRAA